MNIQTLFIISALVVSVPSMAQVETRLNSKKIYYSQDTTYFVSNTICYYKVKDQEKRFIDGYPNLSSVGFSNTPNSIQCTNFTIHNHYALGIFFYHFSLKKDSLSLYAARKDIHFGCTKIDVKKLRLKEQQKFRTPSVHGLNIPQKEYLSHPMKQFSYDFLVDNNHSLKLLICAENKLHIYEAADSKHLEKNEWKHLKTLDINFKTDYFVSYYDKKHKRIQVLFDKRGTVSIDPTTWKWTRDSTAQNTDKYLLIDANHPMDVKIIDKKMAYDLTQK